MRDVSEIYRSNKEIIQKFPFYGVFMLGMNKKFVSAGEITRAAVVYDKIRNSFTLVINENFWEEIETKYGDRASSVKCGIIIHECLHVIFFHFSKFTEKYPDHELLNIAMDMEVNQYIDSDNLPDDGIFIDKYRELGYKLNYNAGYEYYYEELSKNRPNIKNNGDGTYTISSKGKKITVYVGDHKDSYGDCGEPSEGNFNDMESKLRSMIRNAANGTEHGSLPGNIIKYVLEMIKVDKPKVKWNTMFRRMIGNSSKVVVRNSRKKQNRRVNAFPGLRIRTLGSILVCVDTSGSVSDRMLTEFWNELYHIGRLGYEIDVVECDAEIQSVQKYNKGKKPEISGRGGTDYNAPMKYYMENRSKYTTCVYFTDGECDAPTVSVGGSGLIWVISNKYNNKAGENFPGKVIRI